MKNTLQSVVLGLAAASTIASNTTSANIPDNGTLPIESIIEINHLGAEVLLQDGIEGQMGNIDLSPLTIFPAPYRDKCPPIDHAINLIQWN